MNEPIPSLAEQESFWNEWNSRYRRHVVDEFMARQRDTAIEWIRRAGIQAPRLIEIGCGTGWLTGALARHCGARAIGFDLSKEAIEVARATYPDLEFHAGDILTAAPEGEFDVVVSADVIAHIPDQPAVVALAAKLLRPGGLFILMTQNPFVWTRSSYLSRPGQGQYRNWPTLKRIRELLASQFRVLKVTSIAPGGDRGILAVIHNRYVSGVLRRLLGESRLRRLEEALLIGRELVVIAERQAPDVPLARQTGDRRS